MVRPSSDLSPVVAGGFWYNPGMRTLLVPKLLGHWSLTIEGDEAHHGRNVLRLAQGDP